VPVHGRIEELEAAIGMGLATAFVLTLASGASYLVNEYLLARIISICARCRSSW